MPSSVTLQAATRFSSHKWTILVGLAFLGSLLWSATRCDGYSDLFLFFFLACFAVSFLASVVLGIALRLKDALYRVLLNIVFCLLFLPVAKLGGFFRDRLFLMHLSRFQEVTETRVRNERAKANSDTFSAGVPVPNQH